MDRREFMKAGAVGVGALVVGTEVAAATPKKIRPPLCVEYNIEDDFNSYNTPTSIHMVPIHDHPGMVWYLESYGKDVTLKQCDLPEHNLYMVFVSEDRSLAFRLFYTLEQRRAFTRMKEEVPHLYMSKRTMFTSGMDPEYALAPITTDEYKRRFDKFHNQ